MVIVSMENSAKPFAWNKENNKMYIAIAFTCIEALEGN